MLLQLHHRHDPAGDGRTDGQLDGHLKLSANAADADHEAVVRRQRSWALWLLIAALVVILAIGFYLGVTHQEARPQHNRSLGTVARPEPCAPAPAPSRRAHPFHAYGAC